MLVPFLEPASRTCGKVLLNGAYLWRSSPECRLHPTFRGTLPYRTRRLPVLNTEH